MKGQPKPTDFWAKLRPKYSDHVDEWHPLEAHCADVAAVVESLLTKTLLRGRLGALAGRDLTDVDVGRLSSLAALHDAGKVNHGFQNKAWSDPNLDRAGHVGPMVNALKGPRDTTTEIFRALGLPQLLGWFEEPSQLEEFMLATWGHHGRPVQPTPDFKPRLWESTDGRKPQEGLRSLFACVQKWFPAAFTDDAPSLPVSPEFQHAYNGVLTLADWIGSDERYFSFADRDEDWIERARSSAQDAVDSFGLNAQPARASLEEDVGFDQISDFEPYDIQAACVDLPIDTDGSLAILESDTGSGKTEAALARFMRLHAHGEVDGMYIALPTRAAAKQLHGRVVEAVRRAFPDESLRPPVTLAVPGYLRVDELEGRRVSNDDPVLPDFEVQWPDESGQEMTRRGWAAEHPKRFLASPIAVGTVDQVLLSALQLNHAHLRASSLLRQFLVVDEVHASDPYMSRILEEVLDLHLQAGGHAFLMSATLGTATRSRLASGGTQPPPELNEAVDQPYPLVTHASADRQNPVYEHAESSDYSKRVFVESLSIADEPETITEEAVSAANEGARVLVIRNTVAGCREVQEALERSKSDDITFSINGVPSPHHSRYAPSDRRLLDDRIEEVFGKQSQEEGVVCVATQTVEQSLDIDADLLLTDLAPVDVLLQRIGRLHRHPHARGKRPEGYREPKTKVLVPDERDLGVHIREGGAHPGAASGPHGLGTVYGDLRILEATWRLIEEYQAWTIPEMNRELVERATHPDALDAVVDDLGEPWPEHATYIEGVRYAERTQSGINMIDRSKPFAAGHFARDLDEKIKTRLGQDDRQVDFEEPATGPFGLKIYGMSIPGWMVQGADDDEIAEDVHEGSGWVEFRFGAGRYRYDRLGLAAQDQD